MSQRAEKTEGRQSPFKGLRVCMVAPYLPKKGGVTVQTHLMVDGLEREGAEVVRIDTILHSLNHRLLLPLRIPLQALVTAARFLKHGRRCDIVHIQACSWWGFLPVFVVGPLNKWFTKKRFVISFHGGGGPVWIAKYKRLVLPYLRMADSVVVVSTKIQEAFVKHGIDAKILWNLVDIDRFAFRERKAAKPNLVWIRHFEDVYDPLTALEVFAKVKRVIPEASITFIGDGSLKSEMDKFISSNRLSDVRFTGRLANDAVPKIYEEVDIFLNTSKRDGLPTALLEANASGLPIVTTDAGSIPDMMDGGKAGVVLGIGDADALANAVIELVRNPEKTHNLSVWGRRNAEKYSWRRCAQDLIVHYGLQAFGR